MISSFSRAPDQLSNVQPDLMVICDLKEHLDKDDYFKGIPTLVVEILSASTRSSRTYRDDETTRSFLFDGLSKCSGRSFK